MANQPNVLLICTDHWPASLLGCADHPVIKTPTLDQLAANGIRFANAYSECPVCVPARRTLLTGLSPHSHGLLANDKQAMPEVPTLAQTFRDAGYQAFAVGKLHVYPQRDRIGFDDVILDEEGRGEQGARADDYELFLGDQGRPGERFAGGMCNNEYMWRPWHLEENLHVTNWAARRMSREIIRRDPRKPGFWYLSFSHPHPPLHPLQAYLDMYRDATPPDPVMGDWARGGLEDFTHPVRLLRKRAADTLRCFSPEQIREILRAFYALCTHIDHQLRVVLGTLRQEGLLKNTIICFTADHGDMLGNHGLWGKTIMYQGSANVPMILVGTNEQKNSGKVGHHRVGEQPVGLADVMPTLLDLAGIEIPSHCEGLSMVGERRREYVFGANGALRTPDEGGNPTRMIRDASHKLIYYPNGNVFQLFDLCEDPCEECDLAGDAAAADVLQKLQGLLLNALPQEERAAWVKDGSFTGWPAGGNLEPSPNTNLSGQRGLQWPSL